MASEATLAVPRRGDPGVLGVLPTLCMALGPRKHDSVFEESRVLSSVR